MPKGVNKLYLPDFITQYNESDLNVDITVP